MTTPLLEWIEALRAREITSDSPPFRQHLAALFEEQGIDFQSLAKPSLRALRQSPPIGELLRHADAGSDDLVMERLALPEFRAALEEPLMHLVLRRTILVDVSFERLFTVIRAHCAGLVLRSAHAPAMGLRLMFSLAAQCFNNEYVFAAGADESAAVNRIRERIASAPPGESEDSGIRDLLVCAMYGPLSELGLDLPTLRRLAASGPELRALIGRQIDECAEEEVLASGIPSFDALQSTSSDAVRQQYEQSPYPRWQRIDLPGPSSVIDDLEAEFGDGLPAVGRAHPRILVAGCGTGSHPISVALRYPASQVTAIDFSYSSLGFAARQARTYGVANLDLHHGNVMEVKRLGLEFDVVDCYGVLHHLADPAAGLRALASVLVPGGLVRLGLYSARGRTFLDQAQAFARVHAGDGSKSALRESRRKLLAALKTAELAPLRLPRDFFYLSGFRDLLVHAREHRFTPADVGALLAQAGLEFIGIARLAAATRTAFQAQFPADPRMRNLQLIDRFDDSDPQLLGSIVDYRACKALASS
jgi:2-polyprenyl-3-methyl-5-hydroxy-6-metoxy-1,4-benzoquinol methylase